MSERPSGPVERAGATGHILSVGSRQVDEGDDDPERTGHYPSSEQEFYASLRAEERGRAADRAHVAKMAPVWRQQRRQQFDKAFDEWKAEQQRRAERLFAEVNGEHGEAFPAPMEHAKRPRP